MLASPVPRFAGLNTESNCETASPVTDSVPPPSPRPQFSCSFAPQVRHATVLGGTCHGSTLVTPYLSSYSKLFSEILMESRSQPVLRCSRYWSEGEDDRDCSQRGNACLHHELQDGDEIEIDVSESIRGHIEKLAHRHELVLSDRYARLRSNAHTDLAHTAEPSSAGKGSNSTSPR